MKHTRPSSSRSASRSAATRAAAAARVSTRRGRVDDAGDIHRLVAVCSELGFMLPRTLGQIYDTMQEWIVAEERGKIVGCAALHVDCSLLAEIRSVAVDPGRQGRGIGRLLIEAQVVAARDMGVPNVFVLTDKPAMFEKLGFHEVDKADLPRKIWRDCVNCPVFPECHETALLRPTDPNAPPTF